MSSTGLIVNLGIQMKRTVKKGVSIKELIGALRRTNGAMLIFNASLESILLCLLTLSMRIL